MNKKTKTKINYKEIVKGLIASLVVMVVPIVGYSIGSNHDDIWIIAFVVQLCLAILWSVLKLGLLSTTSYGTRRLGHSFRDRNLNKLGAYNDKPRPKDTRTPLDLEKKSMSKSWQGVIVMVAISAIELIVALTILYA